MARRKISTFGDEGERTTCRCPKCGKTHDQIIYWTGRGIPRIFCEDCRGESEIIEYNHHTDIRDEPIKISLIPLIPTMPMSAIAKNTRKKHVVNADNHRYNT